MMTRVDDNSFAQTLDIIYKELFLKIQQGTLDVFLCGGVSTKKEISARDKLKKKLEANNSFRILYPEDLFMDILNLNKNHNLLFLEQILANNCDCICIVCESVGAFVELGAFTNNADTFQKVIALVQTKYKNQKSFIMLGPIKYIQANKKDNVIFYNSNLDEAQEKLAHVINGYKAKKTPKKLDTIVGLHYFILLVLYFFRRIEMKKTIEALKSIMKQNGFIITDSNFDIVFKSAMKLLYKERAVERDSASGIDCYCLTDEGLTTCYKLISKARVFDKYYLCDRIRLGVLEKAYY